MSDFTLTDYDDRPIAVGTRVALWNADLEVSFDVDGMVGVVTDLGEWDGDYSDELERAVGIPPQVTVRYDDGTTESYVTSEWSQAGWSGQQEGRVEELVAL